MSAHDSSISIQFEGTHQKWPGLPGWTRRSRDRYPRRSEQWTTKEPDLGNASRHDLGEASRSILESEATPWLPAGVHIRHLLARSRYSAESQVADAFILRVENSLYEQGFTRNAETTILNRQFESRSISCISDSYQIITVDPFFKINIEPLGTKSKFWFLEPESGSMWLFKYPRTGSGEHWAEKIAPEIAKLMDIPSARTGLAEFEGQRDSASDLFSGEG